MGVFALSARCVILASMSSVEASALVPLTTIADAAEYSRFRTRYLQGILEDPTTERASLEAIAAGDPEPWILEALLVHPSTDAGILSLALRSLVESGQIRRPHASTILRILENYDIPSDIATCIANVLGDEVVSMAVLRLPSLTGDQLSVLPRLESIKGIKACLESGKAPGGYIFKRSKDWRDSVRLMVANSPYASSEVLTHLSNDFSGKVRAAVARNANTDVDRLRLLAGDNDQVVSRAAARSLRKRGEPLVPEDTDDFVSLDDPVFGFFASHAEDSTLQLDVARSISTDPQVLVDLAGHQDFKVSALALQNPSLPVEYMYSLVESGLGDLRAGASVDTVSWESRKRLQAAAPSLIRNPSLPDDLAEVLISRRLAVGTDVAILIDRFGSMSDSLQRLVFEYSGYTSTVCRALARRPDVAADLCGELVKRGVMVQRVLAANPACSVDVLRDLVADRFGDERASLVARATLDGLGGVPSDSGLPTDQS